MSSTEITSYNPTYQALSCLLLLLCGFVQFSNSLYRLVDFLPDTIDFVWVASKVRVDGPLHTRGQALSHLIFPERVCPMLLLFEDIGKLETSHRIVSVFFEGVE